jgi:hypothetical protein
MKIWFIPSTSNSITVTVFTDDNSTASTSLTFSVLANATFTVKGGAYDSRYFSKTFFDTDDTGMKYRTININSICRWFKYCISNTTGNISIQGVTLVGQELVNKEVSTVQ